MPAAPCPSGAAVARGGPGGYRAGRTMAMVHAKRHHDAAGHHRGRGQPEDPRPCPAAPQTRGPRPRRGPARPTTSPNRSLSVSKSCLKVAERLVPWLTLPRSEVSCCSVQHQGSPAGPAGFTRFGLRHGGRREHPAALEARRGTERGCGAHPAGRGGWAWKGPGRPVDNGDQARFQPGRTPVRRRCPGPFLLSPLPPLLTRCSRC